MTINELSTKQQVALLALDVKAVLDTVSGIEPTAMLPPEAAQLALEVGGRVHADRGSAQQLVRGGYHSVRCLLLAWEEDDLGCHAEVQELYDLLHRRPSNVCEMLSISSQKPDSALAANFDTLESDLSREDFMIIY